MQHRPTAGVAAIAVALVLNPCLSSGSKGGYAADGRDSRYQEPGGPYAAGGYGTVAQAPSEPQAAQRPVSWPGEPAAARQWQPPPASRYVEAPVAPYYGQAPRVARRPGYQRHPLAPAAPTAQPAPAMVPCKNAVILARVGPLLILAGEINASVNEVVDRNKDKIPPDQIELQRKLLIKQRLMQKIETVLVYLDAKRTIPAEGFPQIEESLAKQFETVGVKDLMKRAKVKTRAEMDEKLRGLGTSLEREKRNFMQSMLAKQWIREQINFDEEVTHHQMQDWYQQHLAEFEKPARARWEELKVSFSSHSSRREAYAAMVSMGNRVQQGVPLAQVAAAESDGATSDDGGRQDWMAKGSLACEELDRALFGLPVGQLSPIIESDSAFYIIRVTQREEAARTPFREAQTEIRDKIRQQRIREQLQAYITRLKQQTPVWTIFDAEEKAAQISERQPPSRY